MKIRNQGHLSSSPRRGAALILSLLAVLAVGAISATLRQVQTAIERDQRFSIDRRAALYVAEAGIAEATFAISQGKGGALASETVPAAFGAGVFWVEANDRTDGAIELRCTAQVRTAEFVLQTVIVPNLNPVTSRGFFGIEGVTIGRGTLVDGFDASLGTYDSQVTKTVPHRTTARTGRLGSLGQVDFDGAAEGEASAETFSWDEWLPQSFSGQQQSFSGQPKVAGKGKGSSPATNPATEAPIGPKAGPLSGAAATADSTLVHADIDGFVLSSGDAVLEGVIDLEAASFIPPPTLYPSTVATVTGDYVVTGAQVGLGFDSSVKITGDLILAAGASLRLNGPLVLGAEVLRLEAGATLQFDDSNGPIHLHLAAGMHGDASSQFESLPPEPDAHGTSIFLSPPEVARADSTLPGSGRFHGALYAPGDRIRVPKDLRWLGAITALRLETAPGARLSHDLRMATGGQGTATPPRIASWQIIPVGDGLARRLTVDPRQVLRLRGITPVPASTAAPESECEVVILDETGTPALFSGPVESLPGPPNRLMTMRWVDPRDGTLRRWMRPTGVDDDRHVMAYRKKLEQVSDALNDPKLLLDAEALKSAAMGLDASELIQKLPADALLGTVK